MAREAQCGEDYVLISPQSMTNGATVSQYQDCSNAEYATIRCQVALGATGTIASANGVTVTLATADVTNSSAFTNITGASFTGIKNSNNNLFHVDMRAQKRYLQVSVTTGTAGVTNENATISSLATLTNKAQMPSGTVDASGLGGTFVSGANDNFVIIG
jgi:uncharacterized integral membrane protein